MMRRAMLRAGLILALGVGRGAAGDMCTADALAADVHISLVGTIEVSNLRVRWETANEGAELLGYELWTRFGDEAFRVGRLAPSWSCPMRVRRELVVPFDAARAYYLELHFRDGTIRAEPVPLR